MFEFNRVSLSTAIFAISLIKELVNVNDNSTLISSMVLTRDIFRKSSQFTTQKDEGDFTVLFEWEMVEEFLKTNLLLNVHLYLITEYTRITRLNTTCTKTRILISVRGR